MSLSKYRSEIDDLLAQYTPDQKRSAVMALLYLAQKEYGYLSNTAMNEVAELLDLTPTEVASVAGFYSLYHIHPGGKRRVQICTDLPCALRGADRFAEDLCAHLRIKLGETTADGEFTVEAVTCLAGCDRAPLFQIQDTTGIHYYESQPDRPMTVEQAVSILQKIKADQ